MNFNKLTRDELIEIYHVEEIKMLLGHMAVSDFCNLCCISRAYYYKIIKKMTRYQIYKKYCR